MGGDRAQAEGKRLEYPKALSFFINGEWFREGTRGVHVVINPATGAPLADLPLAGATELDAALAAAASGFRRWRATSVDDRAGVLFRTAALLRARAEEIARILTTEQGKPLVEARGELAFAAALFEFYAGETRRAYGRVLVRPATLRSLVVHEPVGPSVAFCPWNFPALNPTRKIAPALAAGCSIIVKAAEETPATALAIVECLIEAGLPPDVVSLVFGVPSEVSAHLIASPVVRKISFTGSVPVGKALMRLAADGMKRSTMELGGHGPVIVFDDCDLNRAIELLPASKFRNAGQVCVSPTRFYVQEGIYTEFVKRFTERAMAIRVGDGVDPSTQMGPMANPRRPEVIAAMIADAKGQGARLLAGGERLGSGGYFFAPTVLSDVPLTARAMNEEPFGPLALIAPFQTDDDAIIRANRLPFGLAAYAFTQSASRMRFVEHNIEAGMVCLNTMSASYVDAPFGGVKDSGHGSEDGPEGMLAFMVTKSIHEA